MTDLTRVISVKMELLLELKEARLHIVSLPLDLKRQVAQ